MRNKFKKGFTLIELLAVIVILAIIALIATPRIMAAIEQARKEAFRNDVYGIVKAVERDYVKRILDEEKVEVTYEFEDYNQTVTPEHIDELAFTGRGPKNGTIVVDEDGNIDLVLDDGNWRATLDPNKEVVLEDISGGTGGGSLVLTPQLRWYENFSFDDHFILGNGQVHSESEVTDLISQGYIPVANHEELNNVRHNSSNTFGEGTIWEDTYTGGLDKNYIQVADINLESYANWIPIGDRQSLHSNNPFTGIYDGNGYIISNLTQTEGVHINTDRGTSYGAGVFGYSEGAEFYNIIVDNVDLVASEGAGAVVGWTEKDSEDNWTIIDNCHALSGNITSEFIEDYGYGMGGLVGYTHYVEISNSSANIDVNTASGATGGLVGEAYYTKIENSRATGDVTGNYDVGGLIGFGMEEEVNNSAAYGNVYAVLDGTDSTPLYIGGFAGRLFGEVNNSYSRGNVSVGDETFPLDGTDLIGGFVGSTQGTNIQRSFSTGDVLVRGFGVPYYIGGFAGGFRGIITDSYSLSTVTVDAELSYDYYSSTGGFVGHEFNGEISTSYYNGYLNLNLRPPGYERECISGFAGCLDNSSATTLFHNVDKINYDEVEEYNTGRTTEQMHDISTYTGFDFENIWIMN